MAKQHGDLLDADDKAVVATGTPLSAVWYLRELLRNNRPRAKRSVPSIEPEKPVARILSPSPDSADGITPGVRRSTNTRTIPIDTNQVEALARRRFVNIHDFGEQQWCVACGALASFQDDAGRAWCDHCMWRYCSNACRLVDTQGFADDEDEN
ncbi:hypothetical protein EXIGLDRAFT_718458 [Exidia glandulosa HHB12029]|uniref:Uncharacterized protein n=1 Tax=Exidia glandulosa HHB12029 TaxID=1314781 RepID=A0A165NWE8_EXIGL|nr:hypothetical protein EXIGLDRAFT_718458 [Exidia glandulosa HHB12029]